MSMPDDYHDSNLSPPHADERLGGEGRRPLGRMAEREGDRYRGRAHFLSSFMGSQSGTRGLMLLGVAGAALLLVVGGVWSWMVTHHPSGIPVIGPPPYPVKDRPADPGGMMVMGDDTTKSDVTGRGSVHLAPPPEQPDVSLLAGRMKHEPSASSSGTAAAPAASPAPQAVSAGSEAAGAGEGTAGAKPAESKPENAVPDGTSSVPAGSGVVLPDQKADDVTETELPDESGKRRDAKKVVPPADDDAADDVDEKPAAKAEPVRKKVQPEDVEEQPVPARKSQDEGDDEPGKVKKEKKSRTHTLPPPADPHLSPLPPPAPAVESRRAEAHKVVTPSEESHKKAGETGRYEVQLAALANEEQARQEWGRLRRKLPDLLGGYEPVYRKVERDGKTFIRLRVGGFADRAAARQLCVQLHAQAQACAVAAN